MTYILGENNTWVSAKRITKPDLERRAEKLSEKIDSQRVEIEVLRRKIEGFGKLEEKWAAHIAEAEVKVATYRMQRDDAKQVTYITKQRGRAKTARIAELSAELTAERAKGKTTKELHVEIIIRTIVAYKKLVDGDVITFNEFAYLLTGSQRDFFSLRDLSHRYGDMGARVKLGIRLCMEAGYLNKVERKNLWYITATGRKRFEQILEHIYNEKGNGYPVRK